MAVLVLVAADGVGSDDGGVVAEASAGDAVTGATTGENVGVVGNAGKDGSVGATGAGAMMGAGVGAAVTGGRVNGASAFVQQPIALRSRSTASALSQSWLVAYNCTAPPAAVALLSPMVSTQREV